MEKTPPYDFVAKVNRMCEGVENDFQGKWSYVSINPSLVEAHNRDSKYRVLETMVRVTQGDSFEQIIEKVGHMSQATMNAVRQSTYWDKIYAGTSLKDIFSTENEEVRTQKLLVLLGHIPRGDAFWHYVVSDGLLGHFTLSDEDGITLSGMTGPLLETQRDIAHMLFVDYGLQNKEAVKSFLSSMSELSLPVHHVLNNLVGSYFIYERFAPPEKQKFLSRKVMRAFDKSKGFRSSAILVDEVLDWFMKVHNSEIISHLISVCPQKLVPNLRNWLAEQARTPYELGHTLEATQSLQRIMGETLWDSLFNGEHFKETNEVAEKIIQSIGDKNLWPTGHDVARVIQFQQGDFPFMVGFDNITVIYNKNNPQVISVSLGFRKLRMSIAANILNKGDGITIQFSIDESASPELAAFLRLMVAAELHDNLSELKPSLAPTISPTDISPPPENGKVAFIKKKIEKEHDRKRKKTKQGIDHITHSEVTERLNRRARLMNGEFTPREVKTYARKLTGANDYEKAIQEHEYFVISHNMNDLNDMEQAELSILVGALKLASDATHHISLRKEELISTLEPEVEQKMVTIIDPLTQKPRYLSTWVVGHSSPTPDPEVAKSVRLYFETYIEGQNRPNADVFHPMRVALAEDKDE